MLAYITSYIYSTPSHSSEEKVVLKNTDNISVVDSNSLIWDLNNLSHTDLEYKYKCSFSKLVRLLREAGCKAYSTHRQPHKLIEIHPIYYS